MFRGLAKNMSKGQEQENLGNKVDNFEVVYIFNNSYFVKTFHSLNILYVDYTFMKNSFDSHVVHTRLQRISLVVCRYSVASLSPS